MQATAMQKMTRNKTQSWSKDTTIEDDPDDRLVLLLEPNGGLYCRLLSGDTSSS
jgi:hypothetical protein